MGRVSDRAALYRALIQTGFNQQAAGRLLAVSRETVRQRLKDVGGFAGLIAWAVNAKLASEAEGNALAALAALAPANRQRAHQADDANDEDAAKSSQIRQLTGPVGRPIFSASMSTAVIPVDAQGSTVRVIGHDREFMKRVALEVALKLGLSREDMSQVASRMIEFFRQQGDPARVAEMLIVASQQARERGDGGGEE